MPSPFPGMDPYLEGNLWTTFHFSFAAEIVRQLAPKLRPRYLVFPVERLIYDLPDGIEVTVKNTYPDVGVVQASSTPTMLRETAILEAPLYMATTIPTAIPHVSIEIRDTNQRTLVTAIEILSPTNKRNPGRTEYVKKRQNILLSSTHLLEFDFLRRGQRVPMQHPLPPADYFVFLSRANNRPLTGVWPLTMQQPLPLIPIPLLEDDQDAQLDLQDTFVATYDLLGYDLAIDYAEPPDVPFTDEQAAWTAALLHDAGLRAA